MQLSDFMGASRGCVLSVVKISRGNKMAAEQLGDLAAGISLDDWALVGRVAAGDRYALESLYGRYHHRLAGFLSRCIGSWEDTDEVLCETFRQIASDAKHIRSASLVVSIWIARIAYRAALDYLYRKGGGLAARSDPFGPPEQFSAWSEIEPADGLQQVLIKLPFELRATLVLAYHMGCGLEQIAEIMDVPTSTVKSRMHQTRETLRIYIRTGVHVQSCDAPTEAV
jgi:RNA polymerase sigma-70 factor, ECF subfamily